MGRARERGDRQPERARTSRDAVRIRNAPAEARRAPGDHAAGAFRGRPHISRALTPARREGLWLSRCQGWKVMGAALPPEQREGCRAGYSESDLGRGGAGLQARHVARASAPPKPGLAEEREHVLLVRLHARLIKGIDAEEVAAQRARLSKK